MDYINAEERLLDNGCEGVKFLQDFSYDTALIGVDEDGRAVYDYELMVHWLMEDQGWSEEEAEEWIAYNTLRALPYMGEESPIIIHRLDDVQIRISGMTEAL